VSTSTHLHAAKTDLESLEVVSVRMLTLMNGCCCLLLKKPAGQEEVESAVRMLEEEGRKLARSRLKYKLFPAPLYAGEGWCGKQRVSLERKSVGKCV
jgi:hypothetical protein